MRPELIDDVIGADGFTSAPCLSRSPPVANDAIPLGPRPSAAEVKYMILEAIETSRVVCLDASQVEKISMATVQIILATHKQIAAEGNIIVVRNATFFFLNAFESLGYIGSKEIFQLEYV